MMDDRIFLLNCSVFDNDIMNITRNMSYVTVPTTVPIETTKVEGFGTLAGLLIAMFITFGIDFKCNKLGASTIEHRLNKIFNSKTIARTLTLCILMFIFPLIFTLLAVALFYKTVCSVIIKKKDRHFVEFLDSFDVFWSLENDATKSVINVLGIIESDSSQTVVENLKNKLQSVYPDNDTRKIFYRRNEEYGFYYWRKYSLVDMNQYVRLVDIPDKTKLSVSDLEEIMADISYQSLPYNDEALFQILVTKERVGNYNKERGDYGIIFRIHHSIGDGVALVQLLCRAFADSLQESPNLYSLKGHCVYDDNSPSDLMDMIRILYEMPICFVDGIIRKPDENILHGPTLLGRNVFKWTASDENLLVMVKEIKDNMEHTSFSDVIVSALSSGLQNLFEKTMAPVPEEVAVILPVRLPDNNDDDRIRLENNFSVTILDLPVKFNDMDELKQRCMELRNSADPLTNYYFLKCVLGVLPKKMLQPILNSSQATMVFSNLPGPTDLIKCGGDLIKQLVFFVPHKGTTGVEISALSYGGELRFAAAADRALVSNSEDLTLILDGMVNEIKRLHRLTVK